MSEEQKPQYHITWPEGMELKVDKKILMQLRDSLESQFKNHVYKQPGFKFFPSLGNTNFFQHFKTNDGIDFGVCHLYWDKDDKIDYIDEDGKVEKRKGGWKIRWLPAGCFDPVGTPSPVSEEGWKKVQNALAKRIAKSTALHIQQRVKEAIPETEEPRIPDLKSEIEKWEDEDTDEDKPKYLN